MLENQTPEQRGTNRETTDIIQLISTALRAGPEHNNCKRTLLNGLSEMIDANKWLWALRVIPEDSNTSSYSSYLHSGFSDVEFGKIAEASCHPFINKIDASYRAELKASKGGAVTRRLEDFDTENLWQGSPVQDLCRQAGIDTLITSTIPLSPTLSSAIALYRAPGQPAFSQHDCELVHLVLTSAEWFHADDWPDDGDPKKYSSLNQTQNMLLGLLIRGHSRQEISETLDITSNTVGTYCKRIFKHFNVNSQTELMRKFLFENNRES